MTISFVDDASTTVTTAAPTVTIPAGVQGQDVMLVQVTSLSTGPTPGISMPAGWTSLYTTNKTVVAGTTTNVWRKVAAGTAGTTSSDAGTTVTPTVDSGAAKTSVVLEAWRGVDTSAPVHNFDFVAFSSIAAGTTTFTGPSVASTLDAAAVLSFFSDKNSVNPINFTVPSGYTSRATAIFTVGSGKPDSIGASKAVSAAGNYGAESNWGTDATPGAVGIFTVILTPAANTQIVRPTSDVTVTNVTGVSDNTNLFHNVDEAGAPDPTDWIEFPAAGVYDCGLGSLSDPGVDTGFVVTYVLGLGAGAASATWTISLKQGGTTIESWSDSNTADNVTKTRNISSTNAANIVFTSGAATDLRLHFTPTAVS